MCHRAVCMHEKYFTFENKNNLLTICFVRSILLIMAFFLFSQQQVGAIGATAYLVFRPAENSLTDDHKDEVEKEATAWSKRPFSNWKNW